MLGARVGVPISRCGYCVRSVRRVRRHHIICEVRADSCFGMKTKMVGASVALIIVAVFILGGISLMRRPVGNTTATQQTTATLSNLARCPNACATLEELIAGKYPSGLDKSGTGGVTVTVPNLQVLYVRTESDGDWHVAVADGQVQVFITEITPQYQSSLGEPPVGLLIDETGVPYCDTFHQTESWHGNTCWEIHPVTAWHLSSTSSTTTLNTTVQAGLAVSVSYGQNPIPRGSTQVIIVQVNDSDGVVPGSTVEIEVDYASGYTTHNFSCTTSQNGSCSISWKIGGTSDPGVFSITATVNGERFYSSFVVTL